MLNSRNPCPKCVTDGPGLQHMRKHLIIVILAVVTRLINVVKRPPDKTDVVGTQKNQLDDSYEHPKHVFKLVDAKKNRNFALKILT